MTDEEMAEEYTAKNGFGSDCNNLTSYDANKEIEQAFLAGLKAGRPVWHDLRKDPNDLPKEKCFAIVFSKRGSIQTYTLLKITKEGMKDCKTVGAIAWCEIPTFDKE